MKTIKLKTNLLFGIVAILLSVLIWVIIPKQIPVMALTKEHINGRFMPRLMCVIMFACGLICILRSLLLKDDDEKTIEMNIELKNIIYLGIVIGYGLVARYVSFLLASVLFGNASLFFMKSRSWKKHLFVTAFVCVVAIVFKYLLKVRFGGFWGI